MPSKFARIALLVTLATLASACQQKDQAAGKAPAAAKSTASTPTSAVTATVAALRKNNVAALLENTMPPAALAKIKADWHKNMNKDPVTDEERQHFAETMTKLTSADAETKLYAQIEPKLKQFDQKSAQQMPMIVAMGEGFAQSSIKQNKDLSEQQKQQAEKLVDATAKWAQSTKFTNPALVKQAIAVICKTARSLNLKTVDDLRALTYDQGMQKAGIVLAGFKEVLAVYGLNMDKALDSVKVEQVSTAADSATLKVTYTAFDHPFTTEAKMVRVDNKWYGQHAVEAWKKKQQRDAALAAAKVTGKQPATTSK